MAPGTPPHPTPTTTANSPPPIARDRQALAQTLLPSLDAGLLLRELCACLPQDPHTKVGRHLGGPGPTWSSLRDQAAVASSGAIETGSKQQGGPALVANQTPEPQSHVALDGPGLLTPTAWCPGPHPSS